jgi:hypothetical protein
MYINSNLRHDQKTRMCSLLKEFIGCFAWDYTEMLGFNQELLEHTLPIKPGFRLYKQPPRSFNLELLGRIKEKVEQLLKAGFIRTCRYVDWISNIVPMEKKNFGKIRVCVDFGDLNRATPKDEYPMPIVDDLINRASGHRVISFLDSNVGYNQTLMAKGDIGKTHSCAQVLSDYSSGW